MYWFLVCLIKFFSKWPQWRKSLFWLMFEGTLEHGGEIKAAEA